MAVPLTLTPLTLTPKAQHTGIKHIAQAHPSNWNCSGPVSFNGYAKKIGTPQDRDPGHSREGVGPGPQL